VDAGLDQRPDAAGHVSGIVGMTTLRVAQRRKQIGVRRALGARWREYPSLLHRGERHHHQPGASWPGCCWHWALNRLLMA
jgi:hypothetical protein